MFTFEDIFRSIISVKNRDGIETISQKDLVENFHSLQRYIPDPPEDSAYKKIYHFIYDFFKNCDSDKIEMPSLEYIKHHFSYSEASESVIVLLDKIGGCQPYVGMDYRSVLREFREKQNDIELSKILNIAQTISTSGYDLIKGKTKTRLKGISDALSYISRESKRLVTDPLGVVTEGQVISEKAMAEMDREYAIAEANPESSIGIHTWLSEMDNSTGGLKNGELMIVTAFTGHCKTTFAINMTYRAIFAGWNVLYISLEMFYQDIRNKVTLMHSCHPKFKRELSDYSHLVGNLKYNDLIYARFTKEEKAYFEKVKDEFRDPGCEYGQLYVWQPSKTVTTLSDIEMKMREIQQSCQANGRDLDFVVIDYISLMGADTWEKSRDGNETTNNIVKNIKRLCMTFNNGKGVRILSPHQANREGYKEAMKNSGLYNLTALSNAHEIERSADLVISAYKFDDRSVLKLCCLKNRRNSFFRPFEAGINFENGFLYDSSQIDDSKIDIASVIGL